MTIKIAKMVSFGFLVGVACVSIGGCGASQDQAPGESVATESSPLVSSGPACADGTIEQIFNGGMVGCAGVVTWDKRRNLCGGGYRAVTAAEWVANYGGATPQHNYWTNDDLRWSGGGPGACSASLTGGNSCGSGSPMRVCTAGSDAEGNICNWWNCGLETNPPNRFFGGCVGNTTAGTLCIPSACSDGTVEETFTGGMVGCAGNVTWDNRRALCSTGYRPATAAEWAALGGIAPQHNYWTDDPLRRSGTGSSACRVSLTTGSTCSADAPMLVCTASGTDPEGHGCDWTGCGLNSNSPNKFFGGCPSANSKNAGTLCVPEGCADGTVEQVFPNGMVGCAGTAPNGAAAAPLCAPGYRLVDDTEATTINLPEIRNSTPVYSNGNYFTQTTLRCPPSGCGGTTGGALCVPQRGCADGTAEQVMPEGFVGCAGAVTWANRDSLCARGYRTATAAEWKTLNSFNLQIVPTHNYWTADNLKFTGTPISCSVSPTSGSACTAGRPMRLCTAAGSDAEGNSCAWANCGLDTVSPNLFFGGCNANVNAGSLCVATDVLDSDIVHQTTDQKLLNILNAAKTANPDTPGLAAAVVIDNKIYIAAIGKRKSTDTTNTLLETDKFQQNSVSKAIAGAVAARAVDQGSLSWSSTLGATLPSIFPAPYPDYQNVTLAELNAHASGFDYDSTASACQHGLTVGCQPNPPPDAANDYVNYPTTERKRLFARDYTRDYPLFPHGTGFRYGTGAVPAISMVEQTLFATPYDTLLQDLLFRPLGMKHSGTEPDVWGHDFVNPPHVPEQAANKLRLPVGGVAVSVEDMARFVHAALYSPRAPWHPWSYATQQALLNNVGRSQFTASGWSIQVVNRSGGLYIQHSGAEGLNVSWVLLMPQRRVALAAMANCGSMGVLDWVYRELVDNPFPGGKTGKIEADFGVPAAVFPYQYAPTHAPTQPSVTGLSSTNKSGSEPSKAFDGDYGTFWAAEDSDAAPWLKVTVPQQAFVGHVLVNEEGAFNKWAPDPDFPGQWLPVLARNGEHVVAFRVTSWQLYLLDSAGTEWLAATGTTLGVNKLIPVNGYNVTGAKLVVNTDGHDGPVIKEMHLLPW